MLKRKYKCDFGRVFFKKKRKKNWLYNMSLFPAPKDRTIPTPDWQFRSKRTEVWPGSLGVLLVLQNVIYLHC